MREEDRPATTATATRSKNASRSWRAAVSIDCFLSRRERRDIRGAELKLQAVLLGEPLDKARITFPARPRRPCSKWQTINFR